MFDQEPPSTWRLVAALIFTATLTAGVVYVIYEVVKRIAEGR